MSSFNKDNLLDLFLEQVSLDLDPASIDALNNIHNALDILLQGVAAQTTIKTLTAAHNVELTDGTLLGDGTTGAVNFALLGAAAAPGKTYKFKAINLTNPVTVTPNGAEVIDNVAGAFNLTPLYTTLVIQSDGTKWWKV